MWLTSFQPDAFQSDAFQIEIIDEEEVILLGGGPGGTWHHHDQYADYKEKEYQRNKAANLQADLKRVDDEIANKQRRLELERADELEAAAILQEADLLEQQIMDEINKLRIQRAWLMQQLDDEEALLVISMMRPFGALLN
mgnify:CR=1 FL=1